LSEVDLDFLREKHSLFQESIDEAARNLDGYHKIVGELLNEAETREIDELKEQAAKLPESRRGAFWQWNYPVHWNEIFIYHFRLSFAILAMAVVEYHLSLVCEDAKVITGLPLGLKERGSTFEKAERFLVKRVGFDASDEKLWESMRKAYRIRNVVAHNGGYVFDPKEEEKLEPCLKHFPGIKLVHGALEVEDEFCQAIRVLVRKFLGYLSREQEALLTRCS
jgi:hypothetical protein